MDEWRLGGTKFIWQELAYQFPPPPRPKINWELLHSNPLAWICSANHMPLSVFITSRHITHHPRLSTHRGRLCLQCEHISQHEGYCGEKPPPLANCFLVSRYVLIVHFVGGCLPFSPLFQMPLALIASRPRRARAV